MQIKRILIGFSNVRNISIYFKDITIFYILYCIFKENIYNSLLKTFATNETL